MKKKWILGILVCVLLLSFSVFAMAFEPMKLKLGHVLAPGTPHHVASTKFAELIKERTNGEIIFDVYPSSQLGDEREMIEALQLGTLDAVFTATAPISAWAPNYLVFDMPFLLNGYEHAYRVYDGEFGKARLEELKSLGIIGLQLTEAGFTNIISDRPILHPNELEGVSIRTMESPGLVAYFKTAGANPVPMAMSEVFTALQNKTVNAGTWPLLTTYFNKLYTVTSYLTLLDPIPTTCLLAMSQYTWDRIPEKHQKIIREASKEAIDFQREYLAKKNDEVIKLMKEEGMKFLEADREEWKKALFEKTLDVLVPEKVSPQIIADIQKIK